MLVWAWVEDGIREQPQVWEDVRPQALFVVTRFGLGRFYLADAIWKEAQSETSSKVSNRAGRRYIDRPCGGRLRLRACSGACARTPGSDGDRDVGPGSTADGLGPAFGGAIADARASDGHAHASHADRNIGATGRHSRPSDRDSTTYLYRGSTTDGHSSANGDTSTNDDANPDGDIGADARAGRLQHRRLHASGPDGPGGDDGHVDEHRYGTSHQYRWVAR